MSTALKCPNPSCPYLFDPTQVPPGAVLTCPRCGMRFTLGPSAAPPAPVPQGLERTGVVPPPPPPAADAKPAPRPSSRPLQSATMSSGNTLLLVVVGVALMIGVGLMVYFRLNPIRSDRGPVSPGEMTERNLTFDPPGPGWVQDDDTRVQLGSPFFLVYRRENPEAYMAFGSRDFETRNPRPSELREAMTRPVNILFDDVELKDITGAKWLGESAMAFEVRGRGKKGGPTQVGEVHAVAAKGFAYWSLCWAGEGDAKALFTEFDDTRGRFRLLSTRAKWTPKEGATRPFGGHKFDYQVLDGEGIWTEPAEPKAGDFDPAGNLYLQAKEKRKGRDTPLEAQLLVLVLDPTEGDPVAQGVKYLKAARAAEVEKTPGVKLVYAERAGPPEGDPANPIDATAPVVRFEERVQGASAANRLRVVSARRMGDKVVVVTAWCPWVDRQVFEDRLTQIAGSLREGP